MKSFLFTISIVIVLPLFAQVPGQVQDTIVCQKDKTQSYAVYLPSNYTPDQRWPIVFFFEPAARGSLPVKLYADVAEELGYILVCTYNSRNGNNEGNFTAADALFLDAETRFSIDPDKIVFSGFSGGSRLALSLAVITKSASAVIGVGATQPSALFKVQEKKDFKYVGLVGSRDMNYREHKTFSSEMNAMGMDNLLVISNYKHRWASPEDFRIALLWLEGDSDKFRSAVSSKVQAVKDSIPLSDVIYLAQHINSEEYASDSKEAKKVLKEEAKVAKKEQMLRKMITDSMDFAFKTASLNSSSTKWVIRKGERLKTQRNKSESLQEQMMFDRLLNFMGAASFETAQSMKSMGLYEKALVGIEIWENLAGNEIFAHWLKAKIYASLNNPPMALDHLEAAIKSGKVRRQSIFTDKDFEGLYEDPRFKKIIEVNYN